MIVKTKLGQASHMGKHESAVAMVRLARDLREYLEENELLSPDDVIHFDNIVYTFLSSQPKKVVEEVRHG